MKRTDKVEVYQDEAGGWRHRRIASNGRVVATCHESYTKHSHAREMALKVYATPFVLVDGDVQTVVGSEDG